MSAAPGCPCGHPHADPRDIDHRPSCPFYEGIDAVPDAANPRLTPTGWDEFRARIEVKQIIDSYTLTMVGVDAEEYVEACADDVIKALLGWPVTYATGGGP